MHRIAFVFVFAVLLAIFVSSCWFFAPTGLDGMVEALIRADCRFAFSCCTAPERDEFYSQRTFRDEGTCVQESLEEGSSLNNVVERAKVVIAAGKGTFDQARADACLKPILEARNQCNADAVLGSGAQVDVLCSAELERAFVKGNVGDGDDCDDDIECANFGICDRSSNAEENVITTKGKCVAAKEEGESCFDPDTGDFSPCVPGTECRGDGERFTCQEPELRQEGELCFEDLDCESGVCEEIEIGQCGSDGAPCQDDTDCQNGDFCLIDFESRCAGNVEITVEACDGL